MLHENGVALARAGNYGDAIRILMPIKSQEPDNQRVNGDLIVIYCWSKQFDKATALYEETSLMHHSVYVLDAIEDAYKALKMEEQAAQIGNLLPL